MRPARSSRCVSVDALDDLPKLHSSPFFGKLRLDTECTGGQSDEQFYPEARGSWA